jgi:hypothetical protein
MTLEELIKDIEATIDSRAQAMKAAIVNPVETLMTIDSHLAGLKAEITKKLRGLTIASIVTPVQDSADIHAKLKELLEDLQNSFEGSVVKLKNVI